MGLQSGAGGGRLAAVIFRHVSSHFNAVGASRIPMRCPVCLRQGILDERGSDRTLGQTEGQTHNYQYTGERICPNPDCRAQIFVVYSGDEKLLVSYPPERIDFDVSGFPGEVKAPLEEAIDCHTHHNFQACALMIRRTLEAVCEDRHAQGDSLYKRIEALGQQVVLPEKMLGALHNLRLLGNDAAHVEAQTYAEVGREEVETALDVTKLILAATYQTSSALDRLEALKAEPEPIEPTAG